MSGATSLVLGYVTVAEGVAIGISYCRTCLNDGNCEWDEYDADLGCVDYKPVPNNDPIWEFEKMKYSVDF